MKVETFEQTETTVDGNEACHDEVALKLIEEMGLKGQQSLTVHDGITRIPYRRLNAIEERVYETIFPEKTLVEEFSSSMIPVRVLQVLAHAKALGCYKRLEIWSEEVRPTDPILVGYMPDQINTWRDVRHILARWGSALESFDVLYEKALKVVERKFSMEARIAKSEAERIIAQTEPAAIRFLDNGESPNYR